MILIINNAMLAKTLNVMEDILNNVILPILHWISTHENPIWALQIAFCILIILKIAVYVIRPILRFSRQRLGSGVPIIGPCLCVLSLALSFVFHAICLPVYFVIAKPLPVILRVAIFLFLLQFLVNILPEQLHRAYPDTVPAAHRRITIPYALPERMEWDEGEGQIREASAMLPACLRLERVCFPRLGVRNNVWDEAMKCVAARMGECTWEPSRCRGHYWTGTVLCENPKMRLRMEVEF